MKIGQDKWGGVFLFDNKKQYSSEPVYFIYKNYVELNISFEKAIQNKESLKQSFPLLKKCDLHGLRETVKEIEV